ncbi:MAG: hypothetical protein IKD05_02740 [Tidjanibacter sp.]|nr:hypothetical protein [Tidjanibacter sp.]MBR3853529.1 hypothetical protein [Tidjanibacter sp.]MBR7129174.1 hypothetical protein [Tidjanibacter sp.]
MKNLLTYFMPLTMLMLVGCGASGQDENQPAEESLCTIYISNNKGWEPLNVYLKDKENGTEYAGGGNGAELTDNERINGYVYFYYEVPAAANNREVGVVCNNGEGGKTSEIVLKLDKDYYLLLSPNSNTPTIIENLDNPFESLVP